VGVGETGEARLEVRDDLLDEDGALLLVDGMPLLAVLTVRSDRTIRSIRYTCGVKREAGDERTP
jgi:hypothetical protein